MLDIVTILTQIDDIMYYPILIIVMAMAGLYFTFKTKGVQIRLFGESVRLFKGTSYRWKYSIFLASNVSVYCFKSWNR